MDKRLWAEARARRGLFMALTVLALLSGAVVIAQAALFSQAVNRAHMGGDGLAALTGGLLILATALAIRALLGGLSVRLSGQLAASVKADLRQRTLRKLIDLGPAYLTQQRTGALTHLLTEGSDAFDPFYKDLLPALFTAGVVPLAVLLVVLPVDGLSFIILVITAPLIPLFAALIGMAAGAQARQRHAEMGRLSAHFLDVLQGLPSLKLLNRSRPQTHIIARVTDAFREVTMEVLQTAFLSAFMLELLASLSIAIIAVEVGLRLIAGNLSFEPALFVLVIAPEFYTPLRTLAARFHAAAGSKAASEAVWQILEAEPAPSAPHTSSPPPSEGIILRGVQFTYADSEHAALSNVSLSIAQGDRIALVGTSGGGKSTLAALLMGFITPTHGELWLNGQDAAAPSFDWGAWRNQVSYVGQRPTLFAGTVADNIRLARPDAADSEIIAAAQAADAHAFICALPGGYDAPVGEHGLRLSRGQAQRIALARAFLRVAPVWILDEPTAHLDPDCEARVLTALDHATRDKTVILVDHGLRAAALMERTITVEDGHVQII